MNTPIKYKYRCRPGYGSENLLIEFISEVDNGTFGTDLFDALKEINPQISGREDLWMNDEFLFKITSDIGELIISKDNWEVAFLMADKNQSCILQINDLLLKDMRFEPLAVDFNDFEMDENSSS